MKTASRILFALAIGLFTFTSLSAQNLSREETKYWKDKAKEYRRNLPALKNLVESAEQYQNQINDLQQQVSDLQAQILMKDRQIVSFEEQTESMNQRVIDAESKAREAANQAPSPPPVTSTGSAPSISGTIFRVQIGAFQRNRLDADLASGNNFTLAEDSDGFQKVRVGEYRQYENARRLRNKLREIGISDAFIVAFQDGQPIDVETAVQYTGETFID
ncbi:MAG: SPOR domain-containing protein [Bacteroidota bacterium]